MPASHGRLLNRTPCRLRAEARACHAQTIPGRIGDPECKEVSRSDIVRGLRNLRGRAIAGDQMPIVDVASITRPTERLPAPICIRRVARRSACASLWSLRTSCSIGKAVASSSCAARSCIHGTSEVTLEMTVIGRGDRGHCIGRTNRVHRRSVSAVP